MYLSSMAAKYVARLGGRECGGLALNGHVHVWWWAEVGEKGRTEREIAKLEQEWGNGGRQAPVRGTKLVARGLISLHWDCLRRRLLHELSLRMPCYVPDAAHGLSG